jgi:hypothetical protein
MQTTTLKSNSARHDGALRRTARAVGSFFAKAVNAMGAPYAVSEADRWSDWPRFPPF